MDIYKQTYRRCAPAFDALTSKTEKTAYLSDIVTYFINEGIIFTEKDGDNYFRYNMETDEAFKKVRGKIRQAMKDFLRKEKKKNVPEISIQEEVPVVPGTDLSDFFDGFLLEPEMDQLLENMDVSSEEGGFYDLDEVQDEDVDGLSFSDLFSYDGLK